MKPPRTIDGFTVVEYGYFLRPTLPLGYVPPPDGSPPLRPVQNLAICTAEGVEGFCLFFCDSVWEYVTDEFNESQQHMKLTPLAEFGLDVAEWRKPDATMNTLPDKPGVLVHMPPELHYLIEPVLRCGCRAEWDAFAYLDKAGEQEMSQLAAVAERVLKNDHFPLANKFLDKYEMTAYDECAQLYFFFGLLDYGGLKFDRVPDAK